MIDQQATVNRAQPDAPVFKPWVSGIFMVIALLHVLFNLFWVVPSLWQNAVHFASFVLAFALTRATGAKIHQAMLILFAVLVAGSALLLIYREGTLYQQGLVFGWTEWIAGALVVLGALEFTRRATGWFIPVLILIALSYVVVWGSWIPGVFRFPGLTAETLLFRSIYGDDGLFGGIASISSSFVFMFILFGAFLMRSGGGQFVIDIAEALAGRFRGGGGIVAVIASGMMGSISGSAVANTASTGVITIPLMKKSGFSARFAAGIESAASTGGQLMPPIMGAGAFIMAGYTQLSYLHIVSIALLPALLYFASVIFFVRTEAQRTAMPFVPVRDDRWAEAFKAGGIPFFAPLLVLIGALIGGLTPAYAAGWAILVVILASHFGQSPMGWRALVEATQKGMQAMMVTAILLCSVGLVVNVIATTGVGNTLSLMLVGWAGGNLILAIALVAFASLVLGAGLPVTAAYVVLATLCAPALSMLITSEHLIDELLAGNLTSETITLLSAAQRDFAELLVSDLNAAQARALVSELPINVLLHLQELLLPAGVIQWALLAAHMIIFWLSQDSNVTPPVCLTAFTAAAIAKTRPMATGFTAWRLAKGLYLIPLLFAYTPILSGDWGKAIPVFVFALFGLYLLVGALQGYCLQRLRIWQRTVLAAFGVGLFMPIEFTLQLALLLGAVVMLNLFRHLPRPRGAS